MPSPHASTGPDTTATARVDTVADAAADPDRPQPWEQLGLTAEEYQRVRDILGRRPTSAELAMYSVMWSEHCSYKSSKPHLARFGEQLTDRMRARLLVGMGQNAGVVDIGGGYAVTFKVESHNHPSYVEPYQGAATGVGGIVRDILAMGARPVAVMDSLRFGPPDGADTARVLPGVVAGVGGYGNRLGLANIGGETRFGARYAANPLVNALCVGVMRADQVHLAEASGAGNAVILYGARTGADGIGGVSVLASETFQSTDADGPPPKRPSVQVGDPFTEKLLIEATLDAYAAGLVEGIGDLGGAGLSCATSELASGSQDAMTVWLDRVPLRDPTLVPEEILMSESQERMMAVVAPANVGSFLDVCAKWDVPATVVGEVTDAPPGQPGRLTVTWHGQVVADVPPRSVAADAPTYQRPAARPADQDRLAADPAERLPRPTAPEDLRATLLTLLASADLADPAPVTDQYDRFVRGNTVLAQPEDAGIVRVDEDTGLGVALAVDGNARFCRLDPRAGAQLALAEAYRNVAVTGARPVAVSDCLNFGSPEDAGVMWQLAETCSGLAVGCRELEVPVTGGNVSLYNQTGADPIPPTPVVAVLGVVADVAARVRSGFRGAGHPVHLLGTTAEELSGSAWADVVHGHLGGTPPVVDLAAERDLAALLADAAEEGLLRSAHDLSDGGLGQALAECCLRRGVGARVRLPGVLDPAAELFAESAGRALVTVAPEDEERLSALCRRHGVPHTRLGTTEASGEAAEAAQAAKASQTAEGGEASLVLEGLFSVDLATLRSAHTDSSALARLFSSGPPQTNPRGA